MPEHMRFAIATLFLCICLFTLLSTHSFQTQVTSFSGTVRNDNQREVIVEWSLSPSWGISDVGYAVNTSKAIGANAVLLMLDIGEWEAISIDAAKQIIDSYSSNGFRVYLSLAVSDSIPTYSDVKKYLSLTSLQGFALDVFTTHSQSVDPLTAEPSLIELAGALGTAGKTLAYFQGDSLRNLNSTSLCKGGLTVWATYEEPWTAPWGWNQETWRAIWSTFPLWVQTCIYNQTSGTDIRGWWQRSTALIPQKPKAIVFWLTTCLHKPTEEQVNAMKYVSFAFLQA